MVVPVSFRWEGAFVERIDGARGDVPRSVFVRRAVEAALGGVVEVERVTYVPGREGGASRSQPGRRMVRQPRPIVQKRGKP